MKLTCRILIGAVVIFAIIQASLVPIVLGLEREKRLDSDETYRPRKWSQVRDGPYRMVVSSRDQEGNESLQQTEEDRGASSSSTATASKREDGEDSKKVNSVRIVNDDDDEILSTVGTPGEEETSLKELVRPPDLTAASVESDVESSAVDISTQKLLVAEKEMDATIASRSQAKTLEIIEDKSTPRTMVKLARKRERILSSETVRKPLRGTVVFELHPSSTTPNPNTLSYKVYNHFRPVEHNVPRESIIPFLDFGKKLSTGRTPAGMNSIEGSSTPSLRGLGVTTERGDDDLFHDDMDVSIVKLKAVERNNVPRGRAPFRNTGITSYFRKRVPVRMSEALLLSASPDNVTSHQSEEPITINQSSTPVPHISSSTPPETSTTERSTTTPVNHPSTTDLKNQTADKEVSTTLSPAKIILTTPAGEIVINSSPADLHENESKTKLRIITTPRPVVTSHRSPPLQELSTSKSVHESSTGNRESFLTTQLPKPSPTAKILSTAVVTSISVKETFRHPRTRGDSNETEISLVTNSSESQGRSPKNMNGSVSTTSLPTSPPTSVTPPSTKKYHASFSTTKIPTTIAPAVSHKPVNRSLYSTHQREHRNKLLSLQQLTNISRSAQNQSEISTQTPELRNSSISPSAENKTKMFLTIRSRLNNQSSTYRSTYRRNSTKPLPPVLRVIATPSSYIEVPKLPSRISSSRAKFTPSDRTISTMTPHPDTTHTTPTEIDRQPTGDERKTIYSTTTDIGSQGDHDLTVVELKSSEAELNPTLEPNNVTTVKYLTYTTERYDPNLSWVYVGHKNTSITKVPSDSGGATNNLGIAAYALAVLGVVPIALGAFIVVRQIVLKSKKKMLDESEYSSEYNRTPLPAKLPRIPSHVNWEGNDKAGTSGHNVTTLTSSLAASSMGNPSCGPATVQPPTAVANQQKTKWDFSRDKLRLQTLLGEGNFGQVWKAEADDISGHEGLTRLVAVKTVKEGCGAREKEDLLRELSIMQDLGPHPNVVTLLGCCTEQEPYLLIMEYVMYGKLLTFLREHRSKAHYFNFSDLNSALTSRDLTVFSYCVARGMEYIVNKGIIHRDLAARNILVDHNKLCKIADFGMSRNVRDTGEIYEQRPNRGALPIRWMAPEALHYSLFTHKSDVWSFGILVWEIITLGSTPYNTMGAREVMRRVRDGYRLEKPEHCRQELYRIVTRCWASDPSKRPTFTELKHELADLLSDPETNGAFVDLDALTEEMSSHSC